MKHAATSALTRQKKLRSRAAMLVAVATELRPRLSRAESHYFSELRALDAQAVRAKSRVHGEVCRCDATCTHRLAEFTPVIDGSGLCIAKELLTRQTEIFCGKF